MNPLLLLSSVLVISVGCATILIFYAYQRRLMQGAKHYILLLITIIIYNTAYFGELNTSSYSLSIICYKLEHISSCIQAFVWLLICLEYAPIKRKYMIIGKLLIFLLPAIFYMGFFASEYFFMYLKYEDSITNSFLRTSFMEKRTYYYPMILLGSHVAFATVVIYIRGIFISPKPQRKGHIIKLVASLLPWMAAFYTVSSYNALGIDFFPIFSFISSVLLVLVIFRCDFFETMPIATEMVYRQSSAGIMIVDSNDYIIDANNVMLLLYPELRQIYKGIAFEGFIKTHPEYERALNQQAMFEFQYNGEAGCLYFRGDTKEIIVDGRKIGKSVKIVDITEIMEQKKLLQEVALVAIDRAELNEISFLQAQISPHFFNNTLSVIASMISRAPDDAKRLITELGEYLSNCCYFDSESPMSTLMEELETVQTYVNIEQARFGSRAKYELVADDLPQLKIPRLILQPLVENAIRHGILKQAEGGKVYLIIQRWKDKVFFDIRDNGVGIAEEYIHNLDSITYERKGIGLTNIHRRLLKYYHEGLTIRRTEKGTSVSFWIPMDDYEEAYQEV